MRTPTRKQAANFYATLREQLRTIANGEEVVRAFEENPEAEAARLGEFLQGALRDDPELAARLEAALQQSGDPQFVTEVTGGHVDNIVNIARLGALNLTLKRQIFVLRDVRQLLVLIAAVLAVAGGLYGFYWRSIQPRWMNGEFNIAVAEFDDTAPPNGKATERGAHLSEALFTFLEGEFEGTDFGLEVEVDHKNMPVIEDSKDAEALSGKVNAHLIIYGTVAGPDAKAEFFPTFWVRESTDTDEITGPSRLGEPIPFDVNKLREPDEIKAELNTRARVLLALAKGLVHLKADKPGMAQDQFVAALSIMEGSGACNAGLPPDEVSGCVLAHLLVGVTQAEQEQYDAAQASFNSALALNPEYARAYIGLGNLYYVQSLAENFRSDYLDEALAWYDRAAKAQDQPPGSMVRQKVAVVRGNALLVEAQTANDEALYLGAEALYTQVIDEFEGMDPKSEARKRLQDIVAVAYFGRGVARQRQGYIDEAIEAYRRCQQLTSADDLKLRAQEQIDIMEGAVG
jgi:tetratricopeptide (TPR) repeat protein